MDWRIKPPGNCGFTIVGCGGTGGFVAEGLCRLLTGKGNSLTLVDMDEIEEHNLLRQNFVRADVGRFKSEALAERLSRRYGREIRYSVSPFTSSGPATDVVIGCVDNAAARKEIANYYERMNNDGWWIDAGNAEHSGQVLIGNIGTPAPWRRKWVGGNIAFLPIPTVQRPELLISRPRKKPQADCAEAVESGDQSPVINQMMASLVLTFVHKLISGTLSWMGAYIDLDSGNLTIAQATPEAVARTMGIEVAEVAAKKPGRKAKQGRARA